MAPANKTPPDVAERVVRLYQSTSLSVKEIAEIGKCSERTVTRLVREAKVPFRIQTEPMSAEDMVLAEKMLDDGASYHEVSRTIGCGVAVIRRRFPNRGWTMKQTWEFIHDVRRTKKVLGD